MIPQNHQRGKDRRRKAPDRPDAIRVDQQCQNEGHREKGCQEEFGPVWNDRQDQQDETDQEADCVPRMGVGPFQPIFMVLAPLIRAAAVGWKGFLWIL